jgi:hypothetical protein
MESVWTDVCGASEKETLSVAAGFTTMERHFDEVFVRTNGETHYLWRVLDHGEDSPGSALALQHTVRRSITRPDREGSDSARRWMSNDRRTQGVTH